MPQESFKDFNRRVTLSIVGQLVAFVAFLAALVGLYVLWRGIAAYGVFRVALAALGLALILILAGALWLRQFVYVGAPLAWLAMAVLFVERLTASGLNGWLAAGTWAFANLVAAVVYRAIKDGGHASTTAQRSLRYASLFLAWPATAIPLVAGGIALGVSDWTVVGGWFLASALAMFGYGLARERSVRDFGLFVGWLALTVLVVERGVAFGLNGWLTAVGWLAVSLLALMTYNTITGRTADSEVTGS
jgi:hypothetical protein